MLFEKLSEPRRGFHQKLEPNPTLDKPRLESNTTISFKCFHIKHKCFAREFLIVDLIYRVKIQNEAMFFKLEFTYFTSCSYESLLMDFIECS